MKVILRKIRSRKSSDRIFEDVDTIRFPSKSSVAHIIDEQGTIVFTFWEDTAAKFSDNVLVLS